LKLSTFDLFKHVTGEECIELDDRQLEQLQRLLKEILCDVVDVCESNNIAYSLGGGSALGAVRHQGFIPWDDDIDLNMPRADYERFLEAFAREKGDQYWIHTPETTDNYGLLHTRLRRKGTSVRTKEDFYTDECGAMADVFVVENCYDNAVLRTLHGIACMALGLGLSCRKFFRDRRQLMALVKDIPKARRICRLKIALGFFTAVFSINWWTRLANRCYSACKNNQSQRVVIPSGRKHFFGEIYQRSAVCQYQKLPFEGYSLNCVRDTDAYLGRLYGDYLSPPPETEREKHVYFPPFSLGGFSESEKE